jgi:hypothetical protein
VDVTTEFPELIQQDADRDLKSAKENEQNAAHITLPAYLYNMYQLARRKEAPLVFDQVCADAVKPSFDCTEVQSSVEKEIEYFEAKK